MTHTTKKILSISGYVLAVVFNLPHLVGVYPAGALPEWYVWVMFLVVDFGILSLALNGKEYSAQVFAWVVFCLNLFYYWNPQPFPNSYGQFTALIPGVLLSAIPAYFVFYFSELIAEQFTGDQERNETKQESEEMKSLKDRFETCQKTNDLAQKEIKALQRKLESIQSGFNQPVQVGKNYRVAICSNGHIVQWGIAKKGEIVCETCKEKIA